MPNRLLLAWHDADEEVAAEVREALEASGLVVERLSGGSTVPDSRLAVLLVTRNWSRFGDSHELVEAANRTGPETLLVWWDEDAPSDFVGDPVPQESFLYACFLPRHERAAAVVERVRADLAALGSGAGA
ncbi:MAG: hypothetical protein AMXMBFR36_34990 [Acidobacteriota bacterium]